MSKSQGTGIVLLVVPQHLGANNAVKPTAYGGGLLLTLEFIYDTTKIFFYRNNFRCFILPFQHDERRTIRQGGAKTNNKRPTLISKT